MRLLPRLPESLSAVLPTFMFDGVGQRTREEALRARRLEGLYHIGQEKIWDGREVLDELKKKHGPINLSKEKREAIAEIFANIMWGELGAWKVAAQLSELIVPLEAKLAATGQAHDEARHFYVMHDYLDLLGVEVPPMGFWSRQIVEQAISAADLAQKIVGMQLQVESMALTVFHRVRQTRVEPILADLLVYYERDEARHVGLGVQYLPELMKRMSKLELARFTAFQLRMLLSSIASLKKLEHSFGVLGIDPRELIVFGGNKQLQFLNDLSKETGLPVMQAWSGRVFDTVAEAFFPSRPVDDNSLFGAFGRARAALSVLVGRTEGIGQPVRQAFFENLERVKNAKRVPAAV